MQTAPSSLVISIHDVSPLTRGKVQPMIEDLKAAGAGRVSLLVIPDHHRSGAFSRNPEFCAWLRDAVSAGHEPVAHGYYHLRDRGTKDGFFKWLITSHYTAGEGEFYDLGEQEAARRLRQGKAEFEACGLAPSGFIAPAWLLGREAESAVRGEGFSYTTRLGSVLDFREGRRHDSQSLVYSVRAGWRRVCSLFWNFFLFRRLNGAPLLRIGLHPPDWDHAAIRSQALNLIRTALAAREAMTYEGWLRKIRA
jgi:predicted deacetylase